MTHAPSRGATRRIAALAAIALVWTGLVVVGATPGLADRAGSAATRATQPLDINRVSVEQLVAVPGIGPAMARRIVAFRDEHGPFRRLDDLLKVKGIGEKSLEKLRPHLRVGDTR